MKQVRGIGTCSLPLPTPPPPRHQHYPTPPPILVVSRDYTVANSKLHGLLQVEKVGDVGDLPLTAGHAHGDGTLLVASVADVVEAAAFVAHVHASVLDALSLAAVPYAVAYGAAKGGPEAEAPLPAQYNWYDRYTDVVPWAGLEATELGVDATAMKRKTFNVGAIYLMALVQGDGALLLKMFYNPRVYARSTVDAALHDAEAFLEALAAHGPDAPLPPAG